jgi:hypothetical protein
MRAFDSDICRIKREGLAALHAMPLKRFQKELRHGGVPIVRVEDVDVLRPKPGPLIHPPSCAVGPLFDFIQIWLCRALSEVVLRMVQHVDRRLLHIPSALSGGEEIGG